MLPSSLAGGEGEARSQAAEPADQGRLHAKCLIIVVGIIGLSGPFSPPVFATSLPYLAVAGNKGHRRSTAESWAIIVDDDFQT